MIGISNICTYFSIVIKVLHEAKRQEREMKKDSNMERRNQDFLFGHAMTLYYKSKMTYQKISRNDKHLNNVAEYRINIQIRISMN